MNPLAIKTEAISRALGKLPDRGPQRIRVRALTDWLADRWRRRGWFLENATPRKMANLGLATVEYLAKRDRMAAWPVVVKIDISPLCNLRCTVCVHADPDPTNGLERQRFRSGQRMSVDQYRRIIEEIQGKSMAVSLYYLGDPFVHPDLDEMCAVARKAGLNVHVSTNFSFKLSDERLIRHAESGVTHLTVCVDGLSQDKYSRTRVGGHIDVVRSNLERLTRIRKARGMIYPRIEVQYLVFEHNQDEIAPALRIFEDMGVDQVCFKEGTTENWASPIPPVVGPRRNRLTPQCVWPHFFMLVKYDGDVLPCCLFRTGEQYAVDGETRSVGNVFRTGVRAVWNSPEYRRLRRLVSNPTRGDAEPGSEKGFCHGCEFVYHQKQ